MWPALWICYLLVHLDCRKPRGSKREPRRLRAPEPFETRIALAAHSYLDPGRAAEFAEQAPPFADYLMAEPRELVGTDQLVVYGSARPVDGIYQITDTQANQSGGIDDLHRVDFEHNVVFIEARVRIANPVNGFEGGGIRIAAAEPGTRAGIQGNLGVTDGGIGPTKGLVFDGWIPNNNKLFGHTPAILLFDSDHRTGSLETAYVQGVGDLDQLYSEFTIGLLSVPQGPGEPALVWAFLNQELLFVDQADWVKLGSVLTVGITGATGPERGATQELYVGSFIVNEIPLASPYTSIADNSQENQQTASSDTPEESSAPAAPSQASFKTATTETAPVVSSQLQDPPNDPPTQARSEPPPASPTSVAPPVESILPPVSIVTAAPANSQLSNTETTPEPLAPALGSSETVSWSVSFATILPQSEPLQVATFPANFPSQSSMTAANQPEQAKSRNASEATIVPASPIPFAKDDALPTAAPEPHNVVVAAAAQDDPQPMPVVAVFVGLPARADQQPGFVDRVLAEDYCKSNMTNHIAASSADHFAWLANSAVTEDSLRAIALDLPVDKPVDDIAASHPRDAATTAQPQPLIGQPPPPAPTPVVVSSAANSNQGATLEVQGFTISNWGVAILAAFIAIGPLAKKYCWFARLRSKLRLVRAKSHHDSSLPSLAIPYRVVQEPLRGSKKRKVLV